MTANRSDALPGKTRPPRPAETPERIGRYRILRTLGTGGMGTVFLAEDSQLERTVALKVLVKTSATPPNLIRRFHAEARTAAKLRHPHIVTVYDSGDADGYLFLALEYVDGPDLERVIRKRGPLRLEKSLEIVRQVTSALDHAQSAGVVHRDIKPSNILIRKDGSATLTDMGLARAMGETAASNITRAGYTVGTVDYMAPEQARNSRAADVRSDLYSLGCTWFHMLSGRVPYPEGDLTNKLRAHAVGPPPDVRSFAASVPEGISAVVQRLMAQRPEDRYQSPGALLTDLDQPGLCRDSVSSDDLWKLAEEVEGPRPSGGVDLHEESDELPISAGSTMLETADPPEKPPRKKQAPAGRSATREGGARRVAPKPAAAVRPRNQRPGQRLPSRSDRPLGDRIRAWGLLLVIVALLAFVVWIFANLDRWLSGGTIPTPGRPPAAPTKPLDGTPPPEAETAGESADSPAL